MRSLARILVTLALCSSARAQHATGTYLAFTPATSGGGCVASASQVCQWYDTSVGQLKLRTLAGDTPIGGSLSGYSVIEQQFTPFPSRPALNFVSGMVCLDNFAGSTDCTVQHGVILVAGTPQTQRSYLNFASGVACTDNAGADRTDCTVSGGGGGTLQSDYTAGGAGGGIVGLSSSGGGLIPRDNATPLTAGTPLLGAQSNGGAAHFFEVSSTGVGIGTAAPGALGVNVPYVKISATTSGNTDLVIFSDANSSGDGTQVITENRLAPLNLKRLGWSVADNGSIFVDRYNDNGTAASGFDLISVDPSSNIQITAGSNLGVLSHLVLDSSTARLVAQNAVVNASNASGTLVEYFPLTLGSEFISDGWDFYRNPSLLATYDNTGNIVTNAFFPQQTGAASSQLGKLGSPWAGLYNNGPLSASYNTQAGTSYTVVAGDAYLGLSAAAARALTLCAASAFAPGQALIVNDEAGTALTANITITRAGADTIDGATTYVIATNKGSVIMISDGVSKWFVVAKGL